MEVLLSVIVIGFMILYNSLSWGLIVWKFWYWFLLPVFPVLPAITFIQAVGIMLFIDIIKSTSSQVVKAEYTQIRTGILLHIFAPWIILFSGWVFKIIFM